MENFDLVNFDEKNLKKPPPTEEDKPIPFDAVASPAGVSHSPINLSGTAPKPAGPTPAPPQKPPAVPAPVPARPAAASADRITSVKNFFTKLHPGAIEFLDQQIAQWLKENPGIRIKATNTVTGVVQGKKDEPHIIVTIWY